MNLPPRRAVRRQFWLFVLAGLTKEEAALAVGLAARSGYSWFHQAGGVAPSHLHTEPSSRQLSFSEREEISAGVESDQSIRAIARAIGRSPS
jgi:Helix-turn-helix domain